jgi:signal peptidase I
MPPPLTLSVAPVVAQPPLVLQVTLFEQDAAVKTPPTKSAPQLKARSVPRGDTKAIAKQRAAKKTRRAFLVAFRDTLVAFALFALLLQFFSPTIVREHSMENTLKENDIVYIAQKAYWFGDPQHEDIVVFYSTLSDGSGGRKTLVKRVIGVPGDRIAINGGTVYRNGQALSEPYVKSGETRGNLAGLVVPEDSYFVLGDNREVSNDSRNAEIGFIDKDQLRGKVLFRIFPLSDLQVF